MENRNDMEIAELFINNATRALKAIVPDDEFQQILGECDLYDEPEICIPSWFDGKRKAQQISLAANTYLRTELQKSVDKNAIKKAQEELKLINSSKPNYKALLDMKIKNFISWTDLAGTEIVINTDENLESVVIYLGDVEIRIDDKATVLGGNTSFSILEKLTEEVMNNIVEITNEVKKIIENRYGEIIRLKKFIYNPTGFTNVDWVNVDNTEEVLKQYRK